MDDRDVLIALSLAKGIGSRTMTSLLEAVQRPAELAPMSAGELGQRAQITSARAKTVVQALRDGAAIEREIARAGDVGVRIVALSDDTYPESLRRIPDPPVVLYMEGEHRATDGVAIAVVGARRATHQGIRMASKLAGDLAAVGFTIVSGMARGVDAAAHRAALAAGGRTIAVCGCGLATVYPPEHDKLAGEIAGRGAVVSEFPMDFPVLAENFPRRNRIISGLSLGVIVVEASTRSGSLITARLAAEQGRDVFAVPGKAGSPSSRGAHRLIKDGAKLVDDIEDVLEEFPDVAKELLAASKNDGAPADGIEKLGDHERAVFASLDTEPIGAESVAVKTDLPIPVVLAAFSQLQMLKLVRPVPGGNWVRNI